MDRRSKPHAFVSIDSKEISKLNVLETSDVYTLDLQGKCQSPKQRKETTKTKQPKRNHGNERNERNEIASDRTDKRKQPK